MALYPFMKEKLPNGPELVSHALAEHQAVKLLLYQLDNSHVGAAHFDERLEACMVDTLQHVLEEEAQLLPALQQAMSADEVRQMTENYIAAKKIAPTRSVDRLSHKRHFSRSFHLHALDTLLCCTH